ncbi:hypothetical protein DICVIV_08251 [Dictyocaulus viviparus]|uniref:Uncharacterized protein n=1 Tax=Dictyocaulus viviparus TaxID=29172 RepID=A0A0D8XM54_DICVI|nr:hypothetical protein DICVIV_08251 [Dictyocaulus viviparus]
MLRQNELQCWKGGKVVAALASVCGIIVLAFPISMIIDKFAESTSCFNDDGARLTKSKVKRAFF